MLSNEELTLLLIKLIDTLGNSCSQYGGDDDHEHSLFDNIDMRELTEIRDQLTAGLESSDE